MDPLLGEKLGGGGQDGLPDAGIGTVLSGHGCNSSFGHMTDSFFLL